VYGHWETAGQMATYGSIEVAVLREDDLRDASLDIPQRQLSVATGVSGQGTSSTG